ncbi:hypothetical protein HB848_11775 [Listeria rocourtiae]|uniref:immunoglobulin-like domain-containing protein n=1 Tax=Listeria rocourtiae TaxID=647910 RepID=UPI001626246D|nr:immunoglobulin-like domain-containing protein [Listeria rocourtiae]MBC1436017.1 hypothetical protein [Listeria rocourtiae]
MNIKKIFTTFALTSIVGTTFVTPFQTLSPEAAEANTNTIAVEPTASFVDTPIGANLISQNLTSVDNKFKDYQISESGVITEPDPGKTPALTNDSGWLRTNINSNTAISASNPFSFSTRDLGKSAQNYTYIATTVQTEPGKLYQFKYDTKLYNLGAFATSPQDSLIGMNARVATYGSNVTYKSNSYSLAGTSAETLTSKDEIIEFRATSDKTVISAEMSYMNLSTNGGYHFAGLSNYSVKEIDEAANQEAREAVTNLFMDNEVLGAINSNTNQSAIDVAKDLVDAVISDSVRAELQQQLDEAQKQLDARHAENAVKDLMDDQGIILPETSQASIDNAKSLIDSLPDSTQKNELQDKLNDIQAQLDTINAEQQAENNRQTAATDAVKELFTNNDTTSDSIKDTTDQEAIDAAKNLVDAVTDPAVKAELELDIAAAQTLLDAKNEAIQAENERQTVATDAVKELFTNNDTASDSIKDTTDQEAIDAAKNLVDAVTDPTVKAELELDIAAAQTLLDAKNEAIQAENERQIAATDAVKELFTNNDTASDSIKDTTDQAAIDAAKNLVDAVTDSTVKAELELDIAAAQTLLDAKNEAIQAENERQIVATDAVKELFTNNDTASDSIKDTTDQAAIDAAQKLIDAVTDTAGKSNLQKDLDRAQVLLNERLATVGTITPADFLIGGDKYVTGTFTGSVAKISLLVNDKEYTGGAVKTDGTFTFYTNDKNIKKTDTVFAVAYDKYGKELERTKVAFVLVTAGKITPATYNLASDKNITGTYTEDVARITVTVGDKVYKGGTVADGTFTFYAFDKIKNATDAVTIHAYDSVGRLLDTKTLNVITSVPVITKGSITVNDMLVPGDKNITGTYTDDVHYVIVTVDGVNYKGGTFVDGEFKFYAFDKITSANSTVTMQAFDKAGKVLDTKTVKLIEPVKASEGKIQLNTFTLGTDKNITGTYTGDVKSVQVTVGETTYKGGTFTDGEFKFYAFDKIKSINDNVNIQALDAKGNVLDTKVIEVIGK